LGEYEIRGEIGRGGMAAVYLAYDLRLSRKVAIKVMLPELTFHEGSEARFKREARTAAKLDHPNIVVIYSVRDDAELLYFVMKYIDGVSLEWVVRKYAPVPIPLVRYLLVQLAAALHYAHGEGVVHRDVKPANVLVDRRGNVLVTDFGIAKATESPTLTRTGSVIGTPAYMSPEQCTGNEQTPASDQYSLGIVAYELIAGRPPFGGTGVERQWAHVHTEPPPLLPLRRDCPSALADAVMRMLVKDPTGRWPSLQAVLPAFATGLVPGDDSPRAQLADFVLGTVPVRGDSVTITPPSPVPQGRGARPWVGPVGPAFGKASATPATPSRRPAAAVHVEPAALSLELGEAHHLRCIVTDASNNELTDREVFWASSDSSVAAVSWVGEVTGLAPGQATISATVGAITSAVLVEVRHGADTTRNLTAADASRGSDASAPITVVPAKPTSAPRGEPSRRRVAIPMPLGVGALVLTVGIVLLLVRDRSETDGKARRSDSNAVQVPLVPASPPRAPAAESAPAAQPPSSVDAARPPASPPARPATVSSLRVTSTNPLTLERGEESRATVRATTAEGLLVASPRVTWVSADPSVASVSASGTITGRSEGRTSVAATSGPVTARVDVTVRVPAPAAIAITPRPSSLTVGEEANLSARVHDHAGVALPYQIVWRSSNAGVAAVDDAGTVRGVRRGEAAIVAVAGAVADSLRLSVTDAPRPNPAPTAEPAPVRIAPSQDQVDSALVGVARTISDGFGRGQLGQLTATGQFSKMVREDQPQVMGTLRVQRRAFAEGKAEGDVVVPLRWKTFTGSVKNSSVVLHITLEQQGGTWQATSARNVTNP